VVTLSELGHDAARGDTSQRKEKRQQFIQELLTALLRFIRSSHFEQAAIGGHLFP
jgi:hypothetical protein